MALKVGVVGTSWWADAMYMPALADHPAGRVTDVCGRNGDRARAFADQWAVDRAHTDHRDLLERVDAVVIASTNDSHAPIARAAIEAGVHLLLEKPVALDATDAAEIATAARVAGLTTMVPFTYRWMPANRFVKRLIDEGAIGTPHHANLRYYAGFAAEPGYTWRFDPEVAGSGIVGDLGSHWIHLARWWLGEASAISAHTGHHLPRGPRPDGTTFPAAEDSALITLRFPTGALASLHVTAVARAGTSFDQTHHAEIHGTGGTIVTTTDWDETQEVLLLRAGDSGPPRPVPIPDDIWGDARRDRVIDTYHDVFRGSEAMTREWLTAAASGRSVQPDLDEGARVQLLVDAALESAAHGGQMVAID